VHCLYGVLAYPFAFYADGDGDRVFLLWSWAPKHSDHPTAKYGNRSWRESNSGRDKLANNPQKGYRHIHPTIRCSFSHPSGIFYHGVLRIFLLGGDDESGMGSGDQGISGSARPCFHPSFVGSKRTLFSSPPRHRQEKSSHTAASWRGRALAGAWLLSCRPSRKIGWSSFLETGYLLFSIQVSCKSPPSTLLN
jgi:hypothetical protein